ncbi:MAG: hypothetical protein RL562_690, partial [Planctomycetota bacterium]
MQTHGPSRCRAAALLAALATAGLSAQDPATPEPAPKHP